MNIELNRKYLSGLIANADLHAGGLFFCIIYQNCLEFKEDGKVELTKRVVDAFRPMDPQDIKHLENYKIEGQYSKNEREYLICEFKELFLKFSGLPTEKNPHIIPFYIYDSRLNKHWSEVYQLEN